MKLVLQNRKFLNDENGNPVAVAMTAEAAEFILAACNEHQALRTDNDQLTMGLAAVRASLQTVQDNLDEVARVQGQLVEALQIAKAEMEKFECRGHGDTRRLRELNPYPFERIDAALAAAGVTP